MIYVFRRHLFVWLAVIGALLAVDTKCGKPPFHDRWGMVQPAAATILPTEGTVIPTTLKPHGPTGNWNLDWRDEFERDLPNPDPANWSMATWRVNGVTPTKSNMWVWGGNMVLRLSSSSEGAAVVATRLLHVGEVAEAKIMFPGRDTPGSEIFNFPAWWTAGVDYPEDGEIDIAEGLGSLKVTYWDRDKMRGFKVTPAGDWNNAFHWYTVQREEDRAYVYWDGRLVGSFHTNDGGGPQRLILNVGYHPDRVAAFGDASRVKVAAVRVWTH